MSAAMNISEQNGIEHVHEHVHTLWTCSTFYDMFMNKIICQKKKKKLIKIFLTIKKIYW